MPRLAQVYKPYIACMLMMLVVIGLHAGLRKDFLDAVQLYDKGKLDEFQDALGNLQATNDDERACLVYYHSMLKQQSTDALAGFQQVIAKYPGTEYAQMSLLEAGKLQILERDIDAAKASLRKISSTKLMERFYWLALCAWWEDDYEGAINNAENYQRQAPKGEFTESSTYIIAESYLVQKKAYSAITVLNKLLSMKLVDVDEQYLLYRLGYAYQMSDKYIDALGYYQRGYEMNKYSQVAYLIEDRLFELRSKNKNIDISFLYPYSLLEIATETDTPPLSSPTPTPTPQISPSTPVTPVSAGDPVKLKGKPSAGYWIQAGRFSQEANANKLVVNIRLLNLPAAYYEDVSAGKKTWVVVSGVYEEKAKADSARTLLVSKDINCFVTQY